MGFTLYGILAALALAVLLGTTYLAGRRNGLDYGSFIRFTVLAVPLALIGSRLIYCLTSLPYYMETIGHPELILALTDGGYSMTGAMLGVIAAALLTAKWRAISGHSLLDWSAVGMPAALIIERLAEPLTGMGWGYPYYSPLFSFLDGLTEELGDFAYCHPVFAYEAIVAAAILAALLVIRRKAHPGDTFLSFLLLYGCTQTVMESMLNGGHMKVIHFVKIQQVAALVMVVIPMVIWSLRARRANHGHRVQAAWLLALVCILSGVVQEFSVEGADNPYFNVVIVGYIMAGLLACTIGPWCAVWRGDGLARILPPAIVAVIAIVAAVIDRTLDVGDHYRLVLWGIMACDLFLLGWTGMALRAEAHAADRARIADKYGLVPPVNGATKEN